MKLFATALGLALVFHVTAFAGHNCYGSGTTTTTTVVPEQIQVRQYYAQPVQRIQVQQVQQYVQPVQVQRVQVQRYVQPVQVQRVEVQRVQHYVQPVQVQRVEVQRVQHVRPQQIQIERRRFGLFRNRSVERITIR